MDQLNFPLHKHKSNGNGHRPGRREFRDTLQTLIEDLSVAEAVRRKALKDLRKLRTSAYRKAKEAGVSGKVLRGMLDLQRSWRRD